MERKALIQSIKDHAARRGIAPATVTSRAVQNSRLFHRLEAGGDCTTQIAQRVLEFIARDSADLPRDEPGAAP